MNSTWAVYLLKHALVIIYTLARKERKEVMLTSKRKFNRLDLPYSVRFKSTHGAVEYVTGVTRNISCEGLCLEVKDFNFIKYENLELNIPLPKSKVSVSLYGGVVWKKQVRGISMAGIKLKMKNKDMQDEIEKIFSCSNIPTSRIYSIDPDYMIKAEKKKKMVSKQARGKKKLSAQFEKIVSAKEVKKDKPLSKLSEQKKKTTERPEKIVLAKEGKKKKKPVSKLSGQKKKPLEQPVELGFIKQYNKSGSKCKVTFRLPKETAPDAQKVTIVGDFNKWDNFKTPMTRHENGDFIITLNLSSKREYKFKYLIEGNRWENDWRADKYIPNAFGSDDSVVIV
jgi:hypothetical protein